MAKTFRKIFSIITALALVLVMLNILPVSAAGIEYISDTQARISITTADDYAMLYFTPQESGVYKFSSIGSYDTVGAVFDSYGNILAYGDDSSSDVNFNICYYMESGTTYLLGCCFWDETETGVFYVTVTETDIKSVKFNDVTVYDGMDSYTNYEYNPVTDDNDLAYNCYQYTPSFTVTLKDGTVLQSDEEGAVEYNGEKYTCYYEDTQSYDNQWAVGAHTATGEIFGIVQNFNITVKPNPVNKVEFNDITLYEDWDCVIIDEDTGGEIIPPGKYYIFLPTYTVTLKDGTVLQSNEYGFVEYNDKVYFISDLQSDQREGNQWEVGDHSATAEIFGFSDTFTVTVAPNPAKSIEFKDITILKDWDYINDYEYNPETEEFDLDWHHYIYKPSYKVTLNDDTVLESDENGYIEYNGKLYGIYRYEDGQSYDTPWTDGTYTVTVEAFCTEYTFNVTLEEMVSVSGDTNRDGRVNNKDLGLLMQHLNGWDVKIDQGACNINGDSVVNNKDYGILMQYVNGWDVELK